MKTTLSSAYLAETITKHSSLQTYLTIKLLVDRHLVKDCFKAYAYFRWLDDQIDLHLSTPKRRLGFIQRQKHLIDKSYLNQPPTNLSPEESLVVELIATNRHQSSKLGSFILNFFQIIEFDARRQGKRITQPELAWYSETLSRAVTDGMEYFINHSAPYPDSPNRYLAGIGAHLTHMLRDYHQDIATGYINLPGEYLCEHHFQPEETDSPAFHSWVKQRVRLTRHHFRLGKRYIATLPGLRDKIAAYWYCARFEGLLNLIAADNYRLRPHYSRSKNVATLINLIFLTLQIITTHFLHQLVLAKLWKRNKSSSSAAA